MGFLNTATTITITAKLTRNGRERMLKETNTIFSHFVLGDSDANYRTSVSLPTGTIPTTGGNLGGENNADDAVISSKLFVNNTTLTTKSVEPLITLWKVSFGIKNSSFTFNFTGNSLSN